MFVLVLVMIIHKNLARKTPTKAVSIAYQGIRRAPGKITLVLLTTWSNGSVTNQMGEIVRALELSTCMIKETAMSVEIRSSKPLMTMVA